MTPEKKREADIRDMRIFDKDITDERIEQRLKDLAEIRHGFVESRYRVTGHDEYKILVRPHQGNAFAVTFNRRDLKGRLFDRSIMFDIEFDLRKSMLSREQPFDFYMSHVHADYLALQEEYR